MQEGEVEVQVLVPDETLVCVECLEELPASAFDTVEAWPGYVRHLYLCRMCMAMQDSE